MTFTQFIHRFHREESGQDLVEYALVLAAVATAVVAGSATLSTDLANAMTTTPKSRTPSMVSDLIGRRLVATVRLGAHFFEVTR